MSLKQRIKEMLGFVAQPQAILTGRGNSIFIGILLSVLYAYWLRNTQTDNLRQYFFHQDNDEILYILIMFFFVALLFFVLNFFFGIKQPDGSYNFEKKYKHLKQVSNFLGEIMFFLVGLLVLPILLIIFPSLSI